MRVFRTRHGSVQILISNRTTVILHDLLAIALAWALALFARFNFELPPREFLTAGLAAYPLVILIQAAVMRYFGLYKGLWRFASLPDLWNIIRAAALGALSIALALFVVNRLQGIPRSTLMMYPLFLTFLLGGPRLMYRLWKDRSLSLSHISSGERVIIVGAGSGGEKVSREMLRDGGYVPVGFVDDRRELLKRRIHGIPVLGSVDDLPALAERYDIDLLIIAVPAATNAEMRHLVEACERAGRPFRTLPRLKDLVSGSVGLNELREVALEDLLSRDKVELDWGAIQAQLAGKSVLITGGAGSIGAELCRQVAGLGVSRLVVFDQSEYGLYDMELELRAAFPRLDLVFVLGDVCDRVAVQRAFEMHRPHLVFHAAAYKHVPILEQQVRAAVYNNVVGTHTVATVARERGCEGFVLISTDKAVRPSSVMGASKRFAEMICESMNARGRTRFITVRFGNVLGSAGSVVPLFRKQIRQGGPVTVTHPEATRYFMTIPEACQLILQSASAGSGGEIYVLNMGEPVNIRYLAEQLIRLSGRRPGSDVEIVYTGLRPGEKLAEELFNADENLAPTAHDKLLLAAQGRQDPAAVDACFERIEQACAEHDDLTLRALLEEAVREAQAPMAARASVIRIDRSKP